VLTGHFLILPAYKEAICNPVVMSVCLSVMIDQEPFATRVLPMGGTAEVFFWKHGGLP